MYNTSGFDYVDLTFYMEYVLTRAVILAGDTARTSEEGNEEPDSFVKRLDY